MGKKKRKPYRDMPEWQRKKWIRHNTIRNKVNTQARIALGLRVLLWQSLKGKKGSGRRMEPLLGCPVGQFIKYLESKFSPGMSWENYGRNGWHIDHVVPVSWFDMTNQEHVRKCFHYTNMQPMWGKDNIRKLNRYAGHIPQTGTAAQDDSSLPGVSIPVTP